MAALARVYDRALRGSLTAAEERALETILEKLETRVRAIRFT